MSKYYPGYWEARRHVQEMDDDELYNLLDQLYGRDNLPCNPTHDELLREALDQVKIEYTDTTSAEYEREQFWVGYAKLLAAG